MFLRQKLGAGAEVGADSCWKNTVSVLEPLAKRSRVPELEPGTRSIL